MPKFFSELKRRNVIRVAFAYAVVAWVLIEIASAILPGFGAPDWIFKVVTSLVVLGFPLALVFAWAFEVTSDGLKLAHEVPPEHSIAGKSGRKLDFIIIGVLVIAVIVLAVTHDWGSGTAERPTAADSGGTSIVVLPFENISADPEQEYFVNGMHDALIAELARISNLRVISRTSAKQYKGTKLTIPEIAAELGVNTVVEGSVFKSGDRIRIQAQLINAEADEHLWANTYDKELQDVLNVHKEVTRDIAQQVRVTLTSAERDHLSVQSQVDRRAHELYLQARQLVDQPNKEPIEKGIELFEEAIRLDPNFAPAHTGRAFGYLTLAYFSHAPRREVLPTAHESVHRALELDPNLAEAYTLLGDIAYRLSDWEGSEENLKKALEMNPNDAGAVITYAVLLCVIQRCDEGIELARRVKELDPFNVTSNVRRGHLFYWVRDYDKALEVYDEVLAHRPSATYANWARGMVYLELGRYDDALAEFERCISCPWSFGVAYGMMGRIDDAKAIIDTYLKRDKKEYIRKSFVAVMYVHIGELDKAFEWFERAFEENEDWIEWLLIEPKFDPVRDDPRFHDLVRRVEFPPAP